MEVADSLLLPVSSFALSGCESFVLQPKSEGHIAKTFETDGPEHPAENVLAALKSGNRPGHCRIGEGQKLGI
jgi:hypothetical protein